MLLLLLNDRTAVNTPKTSESSLRFRATPRSVLLLSSALQRVLLVHVNFGRTWVFKDQHQQKKTVSHHHWWTLPRHRRSSSTTTDSGCQFEGLPTAETGYYFQPGFQRGISWKAALSDDDTARCGELNVDSTTKGRPRMRGGTRCCSSHRYRTVHFWTMVMMV